MQLTRSLLLTAAGMAFCGTGSAAGQAELGCPRFDQYPVTAVYQGPFAAPDHASSPTAKRYRTAIQHTYEPLPDFAGRYRVVFWGCGSNCHELAIVDTESGHVYEAPGPASLEASHRVDSALLVLDAPEVIEENGGGGYHPQYFLWDESAKSFRALPACDAPSA